MMRRLLAGALVLAVMVEAPTFAGVPWGSKAPIVKAKLAAQGYRFTEIDDDGDLVFRGVVSQRPARIFASVGPDGLSRVQLTVTGEPDESDNLYRTLRNTLAEKYGLPDHEGTDHGNVTSMWQRGLAIAVVSSSNVAIVYESSLWHLESLRRQKATTKDM